MLHLCIDIIRNSILITGLVVVMMMMIESVNIESHGRFFKGLKKSPFGQIVFSAFLGSIPGCMGGFATVSLYTHRMIGFGALVAMMIASSGDEAFVMLAMIPKTAVWLMLILFAVAVVAGCVSDAIYNRWHRKRCHLSDHSHCGEKLRIDDEYELHEEVTPEEHGRHFGKKRIILLTGLLCFIIALGTGMLEHDHGAHAGHDHELQHHELQQNELAQHEFPQNGLVDAAAVAEEAQANAAAHPDHQGEVRIGKINILQEKWMNVLFAAFSVLLLVVFFFASDHFIEEHIWEHIIMKHFPVILAWTAGVLAVVGIADHFIDLEAFFNWLQASQTRELAYVSLMIVLATLIGIIPESGPHMIFVTLFAGGLIPFPVLLASSISQDGHASIPLLAESKSSFFKAKTINCVVALLAGFIAMLLM